MFLISKKILCELEQERKDESKLKYENILCDFEKEHKYEHKINPEKSFVGK